MGETTGIAWTDHTFNPWWGCTEVSPGCDHCYARELAKRWRKMEWGPGAPRVPTSEANWRNPFKWNKEAEAEGRRHRVFTLSMGDLFDAEAPEDARQRLWETIHATPYLDWQLLTKRPGNIARMVPPGWMDGGWPDNAWIGTSTENQKWAGIRIPALLELPAPVRFLSCEPLIGPVNVGNYEGVDWIIVGGESGPKARPLVIGWVRDLVRQCRDAGIAPFVKQLGSRPTNREGWRHPQRHKKGEDPAEWPVDLRVQEFPEPRARRLVQGESS